MLLSLVTCVALTNTWADAQVGQPDVHVGDLWKYHELDGLTNETTNEFSHQIVEINDHKITIQLKNKKMPGSALRYYNREWNPIDNGVVKYDPFYPEYKFPMNIGVTWKLDYRSTNTQRQSFSSVSNGKIVALEKVTVPAGTFDAYRIENDIETRDTGADANITKGHIITWYSPTAQKYIRRESTTFSGGRVRSNSIDELVEYSLEDNSGRVNDI